MTKAGLRITRLTHIVAAVYNLVYIYTPLHDIPLALTLVRYVSMPLLVLTGYILVKYKTRVRKPLTY